MHHTKLKKGSAGAGSKQRNISSFFSPQKTKNSVPAPKQTTKPIIKAEQNVNNPSPPKPTSPSKPVAPSTRAVLAELENLPVSPDILSVPETPDSQIRPPGQLDHWPREEASWLGIRPELSPVCRSPRSKGLSLRRDKRAEGGKMEIGIDKGAKMAVNGKISPSSLLAPAPAPSLGLNQVPTGQTSGPTMNQLQTGGVGSSRALSRTGSVKRLFSPLDGSDNAKRTRTNYASVTKPTSGPLAKPRLPGDHFLDECLLVIGQVEGSKVNGSGVRAFKSGQIAFTEPQSGTRQRNRWEVTSLKPKAVKGVSSASSRGLRAQEEECMFTVITEQKASETSRSVDVKLQPPPNTDTHSIHALSDQAEAHTHPHTTHTSRSEHQTSAGEEETRGTGAGVMSSDGDTAPGTGVTSSDKDAATGAGVTSSDEDTAPGTGVTSSDKDAATGAGVMSSDGDGALGVAATSADAMEGIEDDWFDDLMEHSTNHDKEDKSNASGKKRSLVPDHVLLCPGVNNRYWVLDVEEEPGAKRLTISCSKNLQPTDTCILRDGWTSSPVSRGDVVHLEGRCVSGVWLVDGEQGFLVLLPDLLISGTSISNAIRCMRRAVLGEMFKSYDGGSKQMLNGTMVHEIFQRAAVAQDFSLETLTQLANNALRSPNYLSDMYVLRVSQEDMRQEVFNYLPSLRDWAAQYLHSSPQAGQKQINLKLPSDGALSRQDSACRVTVTEFIDIEENVWSPRFGLKGKIDVTATVRIQRRGRSSQDRIMPLELKTGRESNSIEHRSQVILYTLMSLERRSDAEAGFLLYLKTGNLHPVVANHMDRRELMKLRNTLARYLGNSLEKRAGQTGLTSLPEIVTDRQTCKFCPNRRPCALYDRAIESKSPDYTSHEALHDFLLEETEHLTPPHLSYFSHWLLLCCLEAVTMESKNSRKQVWLKSAEEREIIGGCVGNLSLIGPVTVQSDGVFLHRFEKRQAASQQGTNGLATGDRVVVSDQESRLVGVATGYVCDVSEGSVSCTLDRDLMRYSDVVFRLDQDEGVMGLSNHLVNLSRLMDRSPESERLRELLVDFRPPQFISSLSSVLPRDAKDTVANILKGLNKPQKQAMKKVLLSKDYTLIVGMPGTGKTTTICTLVRILHACGFSVLLTSYTHSAVDNILLKLRRFRIGFLRLGRGQKVHPDILAYTEEKGRSRGVHTLAELEELYNKELVVATTCMGVKHPIFTRRQFDFCIVDEASQISQPVCLGPLFYSQRFVLVGDHQQLPPIVQNPEARSMGMDESLFKRLERHSEAVVQLNVQYRMNSKIMSLSNSLMYEGKLECGSERTAIAMLSLPFLVSVQSELALSLTRPQDAAWAQAAVLPSNPVCFLDTSMVPALETADQGGVSNHTEAVLVHILLSLLLRSGCRASDVGVIAPYRQQLKAISALLTSATFDGVEVNTVDRYQGRDKNLIILSFVRSNADGHLGELLKDWRRLNVAVTRAKHKLLMLGSAATLRRYAPLEKLLAHLHQENMISFIVSLMLL
ncbi:DNA replication ATP-dependent helicase/nuclease DNA2 [Aplochiton taeniatus]